MLRLGWFSTGRGEGSRGLLQTAVEAIQRGELDARMEFVFSNREPGEFEGSDRYFAQVREYGIPLACYSSRRFRREYGKRVSEDRDAFDQEALKRIQDYTPDVCVMAGYMLIVSPRLCSRYPFINLHPALPDGPAGTWQDVIWQLIAQGARETGATVHVVTERVDEGPALSCTRFPIRGDSFDQAWQEISGRAVDALQQQYGEDLPLFRLVREEGVQRERPLLVETLKALAEGRVRIENGQPVIADSAGDGQPPLCLNAEVEQTLKKG